MPYKRIGKTIYKQSGGKWQKKSTAISVANAKRQLNLLRGIKHGWKPTGAKARKPKQRRRQ